MWRSFDVFGEGGAVGLLPTGHDLVELFDEVVPLLCGEVVEVPSLFGVQALFVPVVRETVQK